MRMVEGEDYIDYNFTQICASSLPDTVFSTIEKNN